MTDLVGSEAALSELLGSYLKRRVSGVTAICSGWPGPARPGPAVATGTDAPVVFAEAPDLGRRFWICWTTSFDHYADQLPTSYEIDAAIEAKQVFAIKCDGELAAMLFFETQGLHVDRSLLGGGGTFSIKAPGGFTDTALFCNAKRGASVCPLGGGDQ